MTLYWCVCILQHLYTLKYTYACLQTCIHLSIHTSVLYFMPTHTCHVPIKILNLPFTSPSDISDPPPRLCPYLPHPPKDVHIFVCFIQIKRIDINIWMRRITYISVCLMYIQHPCKNNDNHNNLTHKWLTIIIIVIRISIKIMIIKHEWIKIKPNISINKWKY